MSLFGGDAKKTEGHDALAAERMRLEGMPLADLAAEVMTRTWGPGGPAGTGESETGELTMLHIVKQFNPDGRVFGVDHAAVGAIQSVVEEAVQRLEHAELVVIRYRGGSSSTLSYRPTRAGLEAIAAGDVRARLARLGAAG